MLTLQQRSYLQAMDIDVWLSRVSNATYWIVEVFDQSNQLAATLVAEAGSDAEAEKRLLIEMLKAMGQNGTELTQTENKSDVQTKHVVELSYTVEHLLKQPELKADVWQALTQGSLRSVLLDYNDPNQSLPPR